MYFAFIRSKLEYANIVLDNCSIQLSDLLESVQYRATKIVSGAISRISHHIVYTELGWDMLEERKRKSLKYFKILCFSHPSIHSTLFYLQDLILYVLLVAFF